MRAQSINANNRGMSQPDSRLATFVMVNCGLKELPRPDDDLFRYSGLHGDDCEEFLMDYSRLFSVDMSDFLWYFHYAEEASNIGGIFIRPPNKRVLKIPITLNLLQEAAELGRWPVQYPPHTLPKRRWDIGLTFAIPIAIAMAFALAQCAARLNSGL